MQSDIYQSVTDAIIEAIEKGPAGKFELPWHGCAAIPQNARTGNLYHGVNVPLLWVHQIDPFLTEQTGFRQDSSSCGFQPAT